MIAWVVSILLAALSAYAFFGPFDEGTWRPYVAGLLFAAAAGLLFPPFWEGRRVITGPMAPQNRLLAAVICAMIALFMPMAGDPAPATPPAQAAPGQ